MHLGNVYTINQQNQAEGISNADWRSYWSAVPTLNALKTFSNEHNNKIGTANITAACKDSAAKNVKQTAVGDENCPLSGREFLFKLGLSLNKSKITRSNSRSECPIKERASHHFTENFSRMVKSKTNTENSTFCKNYTNT